jgi:hypothetical protein
MKPPINVRNRVSIALVAIAATLVSCGRPEIEPSTLADQSVHGVGATPSRSAQTQAPASLGALLREVEPTHVSSGLPVQLTQDEPGALVSALDEATVPESVPNKTAPPTLVASAAASPKAQAVSGSPTPPSVEQPVPPSVKLRTGYSAKEKEITAATQLVQAGWQYIMPRPKSSKASWGNYDGRTTWWPGYWSNSGSGRTSINQPKDSDNFRGDGTGTPGWRRGGAPGPPTPVEWLCSKSGGITPR